MYCKHCGFANGDDDHRCLRCGRRISGIVIAAPPGYSGANALAVSVDLRAAEDLRANETHEFLPVHLEAPVAPSVGPTQPLLFAGSDQKVIPFDRIQRHVAGRAQLTAPAVAQKPAATPRSTSKRSSGLVAEQGSLDFVHVASLPRILKTDVPAQIYCEQPVATPQHRLVACAVDAAFIFLAFGAFALIAELGGAGFGTGKAFWVVLAVSFALISLFYGLIWAIAGRETAGMDWTDLQLITFDGLPVDPGSRAVRFASAWLSFCSGGLGLVWAVADEENLTWHDHISKTFPTFRGVPGNFVRQRNP